MQILLEFSPESISTSLRASLSVLLSDYFPVATTERDLVSAALLFPASLPVTCLLLQSIGATERLNTLVVDHCLSLFRENAASLIDNSIMSTNNMPIRLPHVQDRVTKAWHLEILSWLHRGGNLGLAEESADLVTICVRYQMFAAVHKANKGNSGQFHGMDVIRMLLDYEPDSYMDWERGAPSIDAAQSPENAADTTVESIEITPAAGAETDPVAPQSVKELLGRGGGWQFLVDCTRDEADKSLAEMPVGAFLIRPAANQPDVFSLSFQSGRGTAAVQHAVVRLEETGFRCGSYGPFPKLYQVLEAVSVLLPTPLGFTMEPIGGASANSHRNSRTGSLTRESESDVGGAECAFVYKNSSANCLFFRSLNNRTKTKEYIDEDSVEVKRVGTGVSAAVGTLGDEMPEQREAQTADDLLRVIAGIFMELSVVTKLVKQLFAIGRWNEPDAVSPAAYTVDSMGRRAFHFLEPLKDLLVWYEARFHELFNVRREVIDGFIQAMEFSQKGTLAAIGDEIIRSMIRPPSDDNGGSNNALEFKPYRIAPLGGKVGVHGTEGGKEKEEGIVAVLFSKKQACLWFARKENEELLRKCGAVAKRRDDDFSEMTLEERLASPQHRILMARDVFDELENERFIERVSYNSSSSGSEGSKHKTKSGCHVYVVVGGTHPDKDVASQFEKWTGKKSVNEEGSTADGMEDALLRFVDPWEVDCFNSGMGALASGFLGRKWYDGAHGGMPSRNESVSDAMDGWVMKTDGIEGLCLWHSLLAKEDVIRRVVAELMPESESESESSGNSGAGGFVGALVEEETKDYYMDGLKTHVYRNNIYSLLSSPSRYVCMVQIELLDVKNMSPNATPSVGVSVYSVVRCKREGSNAPCTNKNRTKDSCLTSTVKLSGTDRWNGCAHFRFPLPPGANTNLASYDAHRERLFKGPPTMVKIGVYEKRMVLLGDLLIGNGEADLKKLVGPGGVGEDWIPLIKEGGGGWFVRMRVNVRFELMKLNETV
jgi:hypothetical protein